MKYLIPANHVKCFAKAIHCLSRLGSEIYFDCTEHELQLKTLNASRSTYASFIFPETFFEIFKPIIKGDEENPYLKCKISVKTILQVFRSITFIERSVETCEIHLSNNNSQVIFTLNCRHAVVKTYQLNFEECESLKAIYTKDLSPNKLTASSKLLQEVLTNFQTSLDEISLSVSPCKVTMSSFADEDEIGKIMSTEMNLNPKEFIYFQIGIDTCISFCLKDIRSILNFSESSGTDCKMTFEYGGKPLVIELAQDNIFTANFVLATIAGETQSQQPSTSVLTETTNWSDRTTLNSSNISTVKPKNKSRKKDNVRPTLNGKQDKKEQERSNIVEDNMEDHDDIVSHIVRVKDVFFVSDKNQNTAMDNTVLAPDSDNES